MLLYSTTSVFGVLFSGIILSETITAIDVISLALVLAGIFLLRNRLAEGEHDSNTHEEISVSTSRKSVSIRRGKYVPKRSISKKIEEKIVFQGWIGAG